jgi:hypothetical protein
MAVRAFNTVSLPATLDYQGVVVGNWTGLTKTTDDSGEVVELPNFADRSVQVVGTFGAGGSLRIEGSIDGTNYATLTDPQGNALDITAAKIEAISEATRYIRPRVTAGDVTTSLAVHILFKKG